MQNMSRYKGDEGGKEEILARIQSLRERIEDAQLLLKLYIG